MAGNGGNVNPAGGNLGGAGGVSTTSPTLLDATIDEDAAVDWPLALPDAADVDAGINEDAAVDWPPVLPDAAGVDAGGLPNIVFILTDDLGYGDVSLLNPKSKISTPNLDRLGADGMSFRDAHASAAVCTPTRYGLLTGRYSWRSRLQSGVLWGWDTALIEPGRLTVAALLKQHGYDTAAIGKWHLGMDFAPHDPPSPTADPSYPDVDYTKPIQNGPLTRGFDYYFGISASLDMPPYVYIENDRFTAVPDAVFSGPANPGPIDSKGFAHAEVLGRLAAKAVEYVTSEASKPNRSPFFLYLPLTAPHEPILPTAQFRGKSGAGDYGDFVVEVDTYVGQVLQAIDDAGLASNTLVFLTSDNGPESPAYDRIRDFGHYSMGDWRGIKRDVWEGGHRVPFLARWPGHIPAGSTSDETICTTDFMATAAAIVGAQLPADAGEDSYNVLPALLGATGAAPIREATVFIGGGTSYAIRQGPWLLIDTFTGDGNAEPAWFKEERGYPPDNPAAPGVLYDLDRDPQERTDLYPSNTAKALELKALLDTYRQSTRSTPP